MNNVNEHLIRISGVVAIEHPLEMDQDVEVVIKGAVVKVEDKSNQNGTIDRVYIIKGIEGVIEG
jgi:hypothetical protein